MGSKLRAIGEMCSTPVHIRQGIPLNGQKPGLPKPTNDFTRAINRVLSRPRSMPTKSEQIPHVGTSEKAE